MFDAQEGRRAICWRTTVEATGPKVFDTTTVIDHRHSTGKVRGILCRRCDQAIGLFVHFPRHLMMAAAYLEAWKTRSKRADTTYGPPPPNDPKTTVRLTLTLSVEGEKRDDGPHKADR
jgi:hypothetical protein